ARTAGGRPRARGTPPRRARATRRGTALRRARRARDAALLDVPREHVQAAAVPALVDVAGVRAQPVPLEAGARQAAASAGVITDLEEHRHAVLLHGGVVLAQRARLDLRLDAGALLLRGLLLRRELL